MFTIRAVGQFIILGEGLTCLPTTGGGIFRDCPWYVPRQPNCLGDTSIMKGAFRNQGVKSRSYLNGAQTLEQNFLWGYYGSQQSASSYPPSGYGLYTRRRIQSYLAQPQRMLLTSIQAPYKGSKKWNPLKRPRGN